MGPADAIQLPVELVCQLAMLACLCICAVCRHSNTEGMRKTTTHAASGQINVCSLAELLMMIDARCQKPDHQNCSSNSPFSSCMPCTGDSGTLLGFLPVCKYTLLKQAQGVQGWQLYLSSQRHAQI